MEKMTVLAGSILLTLSGIMVFVILGTLFGAVSGFIVGLFFGETILGIVGQFGLHNVSMWQFGAFMGFVGGFLKTKTTVEYAK